MKRCYARDLELWAGSRLVRLEKKTKQLRNRWADPVLVAYSGPKKFLLAGPRILPYTVLMNINVGFGALALAIDRQLTKRKCELCRSLLFVVGMNADCWHARRHCG